MTLKEYIIQESSLSWKSKYISKQDIIKLAKTAIKNAKVTPEEVQYEISQYEDPDDLNRAYDNDELYNYSKFENEMYNLLESNPKYKGEIDNIMDEVFLTVYDLMDFI